MVAIMDMNLLQVVDISTADTVKVVNNRDLMIGYLAKMILVLGIGQLTSDELNAIGKISYEFGSSDINAEDILTL